jgi:hypothetical protein
MAEILLAYSLLGILLPQATTYVAIYWDTVAVLSSDNSSLNILARDLNTSTGLIYEAYSDRTI